MKFVRDAAVDLQIDGHAGGAQLVAVRYALVHQRVAFGQADPGGGHAVHVGGEQRGEAPVLALGAAGDVLVEEPAYGRAVEHRAVGELGVRGRVLVRRGSGIDQELQRQRQAGRRAPVWR
ncbi:hypothetical protein ALISP_2488 [Alicycliphilus sp. B1]|nr:hypothetical protein ALISP_2488 [Alicycliphilus sp. B1]